MPVVSEPKQHIPQVAHYRVTNERAAPGPENCNTNGLFFFFFDYCQISVKKKLTWTVLSGKNASRLLCAEVLNTHTYTHLSHQEKGAVDGGLAV